MAHPPSLSKLESYARQRIAAERYPNDYHFFRVARCEACGLVAFELTIEHHTGSKKGNFRGVITGQCAKCGRTTDILRFTGKDRKPLRQEQPQCTCGHARFYVGECERIEGDEGLMGFFDEGVVAGQCADCGRNRVMVYTD
ncbi:MAG: hypothetical protein PVF67_04540 [Anaerolineae bacterium]|jgi:hypothetical protein